MRGTPRPRVVVIGGGFAGVACARELRRAAPQAEVVLFARENHMVFQPLLPDVAGSSLNPRAVAPPLRLLLPHARVRSEPVAGIDFAARRVHWRGDDGAPREIAYDHVVVSCGNVVNMDLMPGLAGHALPLKTIGDAIAMRARIMRQLERADRADSAAERRFLLSFVVVGGGFSGVEVAGEINDLVRSCLRHYPGISRGEFKVTLLHGLPEILPEVGAPLRRYAHRRMARRGIEVRCDTRATEVTPDGVVLADGSRVPGATVICTVGTMPNPLVAALGVAQERGRIVVDPTLRIAGEERAWAIGDCALVPNAATGQPAPPTAQFAEREGRHCARNIGKALRDGVVAAFAYRPLGVACGIGGRDAVAEILGLRFSGLFAWWLWRSAFLLKIPSVAQKAKVGIDWAWELVFPRDLSHFPPAQTDPVATLHFAAGDPLLGAGRARDAVLAIERGVAHARRRNAGGSPEPLLEFGPGDLLAERTLDDLGVEGVEVVAATQVDVSVLDRAVLARLSGALVPLQEMVARAVRRPGRIIWRHHPAAWRALSGLRARDVGSAAQGLRMPPDARLGDACAAIAREIVACILVVEDGRLLGIASRTDLLAALAGGADRDTPLARAMNARVVALDADATAVAAAELMAARHLKFLPLVESDGRLHGLLASDDFVRLALSQPR